MKTRLMNDFKEAMRNKDAIKKTVVAEIRAAIKLKEINESIELNDAQIITVIQKIQKDTTESLEAFETAGNEEQVAEMKARIEIATSYLPKEMDDSELKAMIEGFVETLEEKSMKSMGKTIAVVKTKVEDAGYLVNGGKLSGFVKTALS